MILIISFGRVQDGSDFLTFKKQEEGELKAGAVSVCTKYLTNMKKRKENITDVQIMQRTVKKCV